MHGDVPLLPKPYPRDQVAAELGRLLAAGARDGLDSDTQNGRPHLEAMTRRYSALSRPSRNNR